MLIKFGDKLKFRNNTKEDKINKLGEKSYIIGRSLLDDKEYVDTNNIAVAFNSDYINEIGSIFLRESRVPSDGKFQGIIQAGYTVYWFIPIPYITKVLMHSPTDLKLLYELQAKKNRSPVEEYILFGLENS
jgi:hypothetical protein